MGSCGTKLQHESEQIEFSDTEFDVGKCVVIKPKKTHQTTEPDIKIEQDKKIQPDKNIHPHKKIELSELYHEKQHWEMCLLHALNSLLQKQHFTSQQLNHICNELSPNKLINPHHSIFKTG
eukprot:1015035_1